MTPWAKVALQAIGWGSSLHTQLVEQRFGILQVSRLEALGKPPVDGLQQVMCLPALALFCQQAGEADCGAEFQQFGALALRDVNGPPETGFGSGAVCAVACEKQLALAPLQFRIPIG